MVISQPSYEPMRFENYITNDKTSMNFHLLSKISESSYAGTLLVRLFSDFGFFVRRLILVTKAVNAQVHSYLILQDVGIRSSQSLLCISKANNLLTSYWSWRHLELPLFTPGNASFYQAQYKNLYAVEPLMRGLGRVSEARAFYRGVRPTEVELI